MKKAFALAMTLGMILSLTACGKKDKFKSESKKLIKAAEAACDAEEANKKQIKAMTNRVLNPNDEVFNDGAYYTLTSDEIEDLHLVSIETEDLSQVLFFFKSEGSSMVGSFVIEFSEEDEAKKYFKSVKKDFKGAEDGFETNAEDSEDYAYVCSIEDEEIIVGEEDGDYNEATLQYFRMDGKVVTYILFEGEMDADIYEEYYDLLSEGKYCDLDDLMND